MKSIFTTALFVCICHWALAQRVCATTEYVRSHPIDLTTTNEAARGAIRDTVANEVINIPVVIHLIYKENHQNLSEAQIRSQIDVLNKDFRLKNLDAKNIPAAFAGRAADTRINFCLARVDPDGRSTSGIIRKKTSKDYFMGDDGMKFTNMGGDNAWDSKRYLNIWVCNMFGRSLGYATAPGSQADKDGVVINFDVFGSTGYLRRPFDKGRTATHEIGHWLGLKHIWGDDDCGSDDVDDTPRQQGYNYGCPTYPVITSCSQNSYGDMFMNFMDFTDDGCMSMFTNGQKTKMRAMFSKTGKRNGFLYSTSCDSSTATAGPLPQDTIKPVAAVVVVPADQISVYPNPVMDYITVKSKDVLTLQGKIASVYSPAGTLILQQQLKTNNDKLKLGHLIPGVYLLKIGDGDGSRSFKIIKI
ncbi:MAG: hypothetical protein JWQ27_3286 [Ferruginibacter sp.]|nr:hypothetical protein [Ferruginibacter sp.]